MKIIKTFYAIGQGCFYSEKLHFGDETKTIVYDCGSTSSKQVRLKEEISNLDITTIDYLVISHFHEDHINGIEFLQDKCEIINVIIPKIDAIDVAFYLGTGNTIENILLNPKEFWGDTNIITIYPDGEEILREDSNTQSHNKPITIIKDYCRKIWQLRFYVDKRVFFNNDLDDEQSELIEKTLKITDYSNNIAKLKEAYKILSKKNINLTSMTMLSAPSCKSCIANCKSTFTIMNGDILLNNEKKIQDYTNHYSEYRKSTFDFHIPHHGSNKNLKRPIIEWKIDKCIIMSGYNKPYGHPSDIIINMLNNPRVLTEKDENITSELNCESCELWKVCCLTSI